MAFFRNKHFVLITAAVALAACEGGNNVLFPSLGSSSSGNTGSAGFTVGAEGGPPQLGSTYFEPEGVSPGAPTGTFVGQKVVSFRQELTQLQETIRSQNTQLQALRNKTIQDSNGYHENVASMRARLQLGTTPGNPILMNRWETAQAQLNTINQDIVLMDQLAQMISVNQATAAYLMNSVRSSYAIPGAVDEDHRQLRVLEDETQQTVVLIDRLLNELASDIRRQSAYVANERGNLSSLTSAIRNGQLFGAIGPDGYSTGGTGGAVPQLAGAPTSLRSMGPASAGAEPGGVPLVVIRFDQPNVRFEDALTRAAQAALARNPNTVFSVVAVSGGSASAAARGAEQVVRVLSRLGIPPSRITQSATTTPGTDEVRVFVR
ncbi:hypothetical protein [Pararhodospirillum oryzae]|uniref:OmpA-like domain-containing protein n=1 Tax=Pararhodospirillum oryzae TaxID=478448 RepID=A0A512H4K3_9PROT|nr:hypothetical protein [Pararhodospirillum oryzae]GEO80382.1 hypothetical protein ROR02_05130 [Pararhodospirillum oryzae]